MNSPEIVAALRKHAVGAHGTLFDSHADMLYQYCWFLLRDREQAQAALRDVMLLADAHVTRLKDARKLEPWLLALARAVCRQRGPAPADETDEPIARPEQRDVDLILGSSRAGADELLAAARHDLEQSLADEILVSAKIQECAGRTEAMRGWAGTVTQAIRRKLLRHAAACEACLPHLPRNVSAARVYSLLPWPLMPAGTRTLALDALNDTDADGRRQAVAGLVTAFDAAGFPLTAAVDMPDGEAAPGASDPGD